MIIAIIGPELWLTESYKRTLPVCFIPVLTLAVINLLHLYTVSGRSLTLFIFPCMALGTAVIAQAGWDRLLVAAGLTSGRMASFLMVSIVFVFIVGTHSEEWGNIWPEDEETSGLIAYLHSEAKSTDIVYENASLAEPTQLYFKILRWTPEQLYFGNTAFRLGE